MLAVVEGQRHELMGLVVSDARGNEVAVEAGVLTRKGASGRRGRAAVRRPAVRVGAQRQVARERVDSLRAQVGIAGESAGRKQGRARCGSSARGRRR